MPETLFMDIETDKANQLVCVAWAFGRGHVWVAPTLMHEIELCLQDPDQVVVTHTKYDLRWLRLNGGVNGVRAQLHDTQVMAWLINETIPLDLASLSLRYLAETLDKSLQKKAGEAPWDDVAAYCQKDVAVTRKLYHALYQRLTHEGLADYFEAIEAAFTRTLLDMECRGLPVDLRATETLADSYRKTREELGRTLTAGLPSAFNLNSPQHVGKLLGSSTFQLEDRQPHDPDAELGAVLAELAGGSEAVEDAVGDFVVTKLGRKWDQGYWVCAGLRRNGPVNQPLKSVARPVLALDPQWATDPWVEQYLEWKKLDKVLGTYLDVFPKVARNGRIYARFNQTGTVTGRLSSSQPNLQNIPARGESGHAIRQVFRGNLIVGDFAQLEPRLMAHFSQDPELLRIFNNGLDVYLETAQLVGCDRQTAKVLVLAMGYGAGRKKLAQILTLAGVPTTGQQAQDLLHRTQEAYMTYFLWRSSTITRAKRLGYVETLDHRRRRFQGGEWGWKGGGDQGRQAANARIQGSAADVVRRVMVATSKLYPQLGMLAQVHDELLWEYDPKQVDPAVVLPTLRTWVERIAGTDITVPLIFEPHVGSSWGDAKDGGSSTAATVANIMGASA